MIKDRFAELLKLYLNDKATDEERDELMQLIREGCHDITIMESINETLLKGQVQDDLDSRQARRMLKGILATTDEKGKIISISPAHRPLKWVAAAAVFLIAIYGGWWTSRIEPVSPHLITSEQKMESAFFTGKQFVRLPDGSTVLLNEASELRLSPLFGEQAREAILTGEGYFEVRRDPSKPFKVITGKVTTTVLGTAFNVKAYPGQKEIKVTVTRGKVRVSDDQRTFGIITPNQQIAVNTATDDFVQSNLKDEKAEAWQSKYLILDDISMEEAVETIAEKYKVKIYLTNDDLKKCRISATFLNGENLDQVLIVISGVVKATYSRQPDGTLLIGGPGCK